VVQIDFSEWERSSPAGKRLVARLRASGEEMALAIATVEEELRGWLAEINRHRGLNRQIVPYAKLQREVECCGECQPK
jgi:pilus assembly protein TadC